jgi:glycosyltransferase involved in cell wall biosynthesis
MRANLPKAVVAFAGARDAYQVPLALAEANLLECLVTDRHLPQFLQPILELTGRSGLAVPSFGRSRIKVPIGALADFALEKFGFGSVGGWNKGAAMGAAARELARRDQAAVFSYSTSAFEAFSAPDIPHKLLFQYHPHPHSVRKILLEEVERVPWAARSLRREPELALSEEKFELLCKESKMATGIVVASTFTQETLLANGIKQSLIRLLPYGVDARVFRERSFQPSASPLRLAFVGNVEQRKGISYLLEAFRLCGSQALQVVICTRFQPAALWKNKFPENVEVHTGLSRQQLVNTLHTCHLLALPSIVEGFGHVILEGMSLGLPLIATPHTGGRDVIQDGRNGFLVPIRDSAAIARKLEWALCNSSKLREMGAEAAKTAREFSWDRFRLGIVAAYKGMVGDGGCDSWE